ncbi:Hypothetical Protein FCC1311_087952 [Hondaea fermentalgiana]|uniref:Uncharacterized protein n=1 Tax=Hondaea fermentalgiana TaxID=2315210 RepID=A0A2R5GNW0_9STRA|nr:Hypothetical Protein FCC1311_087952 [Hondaea fermentalgiana]|eukprot:GBG32570.1 Hypothetical Protein FCC1311_087952 [Hondaea fermentalgiana]
MLRKMETSEAKLREEEEASEAKLREEMRGMKRRSETREKEFEKELEKRAATRILQDKVDLWRSLESQARKSSAAHAGSKSHKLPAEDFLHVLAQHGLRLQEQDANLVKFADFRGFVDFVKFYRMLDVLPPEDHVDPSLTRDRLPQPYRMLVKILEDHVIEAAWEQITLRNMPKSARVTQSQSLSGNSASRASLGTSTKTVKQQLETLRLMKSRPRAMRQCKPGTTVAVPNLSARTFSSGHSFSCYGTEDGHVVVIGEGGQVSSYAAEAFSGPVAAIACAPWGVSGLVIVAFHRPRGSREPGSDSGAAEDGAEHEADEADLAARELGWASGPTTAQLLVLDPTLGSLSCVGAATELDEEIETAWVDASAWSETSVLRCACVVSDKSAHEDEHPSSDEEEMSAPTPRKLLFFDVSYDRPSIDADVPVLESALAEDAASETDGAALTTDVTWSLARSAMSLPLADGPARGYFCKSRHFFTLYVQGCNEVHEHRWSSSKSIVTWMSSGILCDAQHMSANGVELCAFGLRDGCITVWNVWASVVRAILRHHQSPTTSIMFMMPNEDPEGSSVNSPQILAGCGDGRLRLFQISSDAPSSAAIRPRGGERGALFADAAFAEALTGGSFLAEFEDAAADDEASAMGVSAICGLRRVPTTPLLLVKTRCDLRLYDMEAGAQIGVLEPASDSWEWAEGSNEMTAGFAQQDVVVLSDETITVFPAFLYVTACYPSIARAIKFTDPLQPRTASTKRRLAFEAVKLLNATTAEQRCDPEKDLASHKMNEFEDRRVETRAEREKHLSSTMERWGSISHVAR